MNCREISEQIGQVKAMRNEMTVLTQRRELKEALGLAERIILKIAELKERLPILWEKYERVAYWSTVIKPITQVEIDADEKTVYVSDGFVAKYHMDTDGGDWITGMDGVTHMERFGNNLYMLRENDIAVMDLHTERIRFWNLDTKRGVTAPKLESFVIDKNGRIIVEADDGFMEVWMEENGKVVHDADESLLLSNKGILSKVTEENILLVQEDDFTLRIFDLNKPEEVHVNIAKINVGEKLLSVTACDGKLYGAADGKILTWDIETGEELDVVDVRAEFDKDLERIAGIEVGRDGKLIIAYDQREKSVMVSSSYGKFGGSSSREIKGTSSYLCAYDPESKKFSRVGYSTDGKTTSLRLTEKQKIIVGTDKGELMVMDKPGSKK